MPPLDDVSQMPLRAIVGIFAQVGLDGNDTLTASLDAGRIDSLGLVELMVSIEEETGVTLTMDELIACDQAAEVAELVKSREQHRRSG
jgi:acyl carrier protein